MCYPLQTNLKIPNRLLYDTRFTTVGNHKELPYSCSKVSVNFVEALTQMLETINVS